MGDVDFSELPTDTSYANLLNTPDYHVYYVDISESPYSNGSTGYDLSGYVFEFFTLDTNTQLIVNPSFDTLIEQEKGLADCSAIATLDVSLSNFQNLFSFKSDSEDVNDLSSSDIEFKINDLSCFDNISFSEAVVQYGQINSYYDDQTVAADYVRNLAKQITGGLSVADIFSNEEELVTGIQDIDISLDTSLNEKLNDSSTYGYKSSDEFSSLTEYADLYKAAKALFTINLNSNNSSTHYQRTIDLFTNISDTAYTLSNNDNSLNEIEVSLNFHDGDIIAVRVEYNQDDTTGGLDDTSFGITIEPRSYKVYLNLVED